MGIKKLFTLLNNNNLFKIYPYMNDLINDLDIDKKKLLVGIDANLFCYKYLHSYDNMIIGFFNQILNFLSNGIIPLYIFDGGTMQEKEITNSIRNKKKYNNKIKLDNIDDNATDINNLESLKKKFEKNSMKITNIQINILLELFDLLNIPYIFSHGEGEYLAVILNKYNIIDMFLTDDTDPIPAGINKTIKFYNNGVYYLNILNIYSKFNIDYNQLCDISILLGSDYIQFAHNYKPEEIVNLIVEHKNIENILLFLNIESFGYYDKNYKTIIPTNEKFVTIIQKIRNIYHMAPLNEKILFINPLINQNTLNYNIINTTNNIDLYSNIMLEYWDDFIAIMNYDLNNDKDIILTKSNFFKSNINNYIRNKKFNIKNITKFLKNNIVDITEKEITNAVNSFTFLNTFNF
jgi:hypothetical protein